MTSFAIRLKNLFSEPQTTAPQTLPARKEYNNTLLTTGHALLALSIQLRKTTECEDAAALRTRVLDEINLFTKQIEQSNIPVKTLQAARYCLCALIDETVLSTQWGPNSAWTEDTLLGMLYQETTGGERFFAILDEMLKEPEKNIDILELLYMCLTVGFEGKFHLQGKEVLETKRHQLFEAISQQRKGIHKHLSPHWRGIQMTIKPTPVWLVLIFTAGILLAGAFVVKYWGDASADRLYEEYKVNMN